MLHRVRLENKHAGHVEKEEQVMGNGLHRKSAAGRTTGLTQTERKIVRDTWGAYCRARTDCGVLIFVEFFQRYPSYLQVFPVFGNQQLKDLVSTSRFRAHGCAVGAQLTAIVDSLDDPVLLHELVRKNAINHMSKPGVRIEHFEHLLQAVLVAMETRCPGHVFTPDTTGAWAKLFAMVMEVTRKVFGEATPPEQVASLRTQGVSSSSGSTSPLRTASSYGRASSVFTLALSDVSLPIVPQVAKPRSPRRLLHPPDSSSTDSAAEQGEISPPR